MTKDLRTQIDEAIKDRQDWEDRQRTWYQLRHTGVSYRPSAYQGDPKPHFPLIDSTIEKIKPLYVGQLYTGDNFATFLSLREQDSQLTSSVSYWFDYKLKQESNFESEIAHGIDGMLQAGRLPFKVYWNADEKRLAFEACDPLHVIVPKWTLEPADADWIVHVLHLSEAQYRANDQFDQDDDFVKSLKGRGNQEGSGDIAKAQSVSYREGINYGKEDEIILWEVYQRDRQNNRIMVDTISPVRPRDDAGVRASFVLPYNQGVFKTGRRMPFGSLRSEVKDKGYYSPRGIPEIGAPFEQAIGKTWATKLRWMDFHGQPSFKSTQPLAGNPQNFKRRPGGITPFGLEPEETPDPPAWLADEMQFLRMVFEYRVQLPDLGASEHLTPNGGRSQSGRPTATQINAIVAQSGQTNDIRARIFRDDVADLFEMGWALLLQYGSTTPQIAEGEQDTSLQFVLNDELQTLDNSALHDAYDITPNGSPDGWNRNAELQKALGLYQTLAGNPDIEMSELTKLLLEKGDPRWVKRLFKPSAEQAAEQTEEQHQELILMLNKFGAAVEPGDDDKAHVMALIQFSQQRFKEQEPTGPIESQLISGHWQGHIQQLYQKKDPAAKQLEQQSQPFLQILSMLAQPNVVPMTSANAVSPESSIAGVEPSGGTATLQQTI